jgi:exopolysaccharide production protein ExoZ
MTSHAAPPPSASMLQSLQAGRAVAALLVVFVHVGGTLALPKYLGANPLGSFFDFGFVAVDFFFVLSGFIIMHAHRRDVGQPRELVSYLWKRFARAYPPYWIVLALIVPVFYLVPHFGVGHERTPSVVITSFALLKHPVHPTILVVAWTMIYEVFFYLLFGLLVVNKRLGIFALLAWAIGVLAFSWFESYPWNFLFSQWYLRILAGVGAAILVERVRIPMPRVTATLGATILLATGLVHVYHAPLSMHAYALGGTLGSVLAVVGMVEAERTGRLHSPRWLVYLGNAAYAIYLVHFPAISVFSKMTLLLKLNTFLPGSVLFVLQAALAVGAGCLFHELVENPLHRWSRRFFRRHEAKSVVSNASQSAPLRKAA